MQQFQIAELLRAISGFAHFSQELTKVENNKGGAVIPAEACDGLKRTASSAHDILNQLNMSEAALSAKRVLDSLAKAQPWTGEEIKATQVASVQFSPMVVSWIRNSCAELIGRVTDGLAGRFVFAIPPNVVAYYESPLNVFGRDIITKFTSIHYDVEEAGKCHALTRSTACAFHSIRCLEAGIRALSRCLGLADPTKAADRNWGSVLRTLKTDIDRRWPTSTDRLSGDGQFFESSFASLAAMQNPWRNATMHLDQKYTEEEAKHIFDIISGFMKKVASRCDENGDPKA